MPSLLHEALIEMFRNRPSLAAELLAGGFGMDLPTFEHAQLQSGELTDVAPTEYRADAVVTLTVADTSVLAVVVEAQLGRDKTKRWSWPVYLTTLRARLKCPAVLLVVCVDARTAAWCATPIQLGHPGWTLRPIVVGPDQVPMIVDVDQATRAPELAVLSAMAHGGGPGGDKILRALSSALTSVEADRAALYSDIVIKALPAAARDYLETLMAPRVHEYQSDFVRRFIFQGRAEGTALAKSGAILQVLDARRVHVPDDARALIVECANVDQLNEWIRRAATAHSIDDLFAGAAKS